MHSTRKTIVIIDITANIHNPNNGMFILLSTFRKPNNWLYLHWNGNISDYFVVLIMLFGLNIVQGHSAHIMAIITDSIVILGAVVGLGWLVYLTIGGIVKFKSRYNLICKLQSGSRISMHKLSIMVVKRDQFNQILQPKYTKKMNKTKNRGPMMKMNHQHRN